MNTDIYRRVSLFEADRLTLAESIELTAQSLIAYGSDRKHWAAAYSGGKDSTAMVTLTAHLIATGRVPKPESFTVLYADTRMELPPLQQGAVANLAILAGMGIRTEVVVPALDDRYFVYMFGRGVPPPKNRFRWCTSQLKIEPMEAALLKLREKAKQKLLMLTGVRLGESAARDQRIALSCSKDGAECGQGWYQEATPASVADTLAPILHMRVCHVWDWLQFHAPALGFETALLAEAYGGEEAREKEARSGCFGCNLVETDMALDNLLAYPHWQYIAPLKRLRPLYRQLTRAEYRLRKDGSERRKDGVMVKNPMRLGPLTMAARAMGLLAVEDVQDDINNAARAQGRPLVNIISQQEEDRIVELCAANTWPNGWTGDEPVGTVELDEVIGEGITQPRLLHSQDHELRAVIAREVAT